MEAPLIDPFGRAVTYLRISVTDRCDFRCQYCMSENMTFLPKKDLLTFEELAEISSSFVTLGTRKIRISGGEPLVRKNILTLFEHLGRFVASGQLDELTLTTNGSQLKKYAEALYAHHVRRINVSLDTLDEQKFATITRWGRLGPVLEGIEAAKQAGLKIKINTVAMKGSTTKKSLNLFDGPMGRVMTSPSLKPCPWAMCHRTGLININHSPSFSMGSSKTGPSRSPATKQEAPLSIMTLRKLVVGLV